MEKPLLLVDLLEHKYPTNTQMSLANKLYLKGGYQKAATIYEQHIAINGPEADVLHNYGCSFFMQGLYQKAIPYFEQALALVRSYHAIYHFFASALYCNRGLIYKAMQHSNFAQQDFVKSQFLYHENTIAGQCLIDHASQFASEPQEVEPVLISNNQRNLNLCIFTSHHLAQQAIMAVKLHKNKDIRSAELIYNYVIKRLDQAHMLYHRMLARQLMNCGICFAKIGWPDIALFNCKLAIDADASNPDNEIIQQCIEDLYKTKS